MLLFQTNLLSPRNYWFFKGSKEAEGDSLQLHRLGAFA